VDVSPEWPLDYLPTPFEFELSPGMGRILVAEPAMA
jgi:starch synthase (maltosyl-transferring)